MVVYLISYIIIALSFALSSTYMVHYSGLKEVGIASPISYTLAFCLLTFIIFPVILTMWSRDPDYFKKAYSRELRKIILKGKT